MTATLTVMPAAVGLCPVHQEDFFFPLKLPLPKPLVRCPLPDCDQFLVIYASQETIV